MKVRNMTNSNGRRVLNQLIISGVEASDFKCVQSHLVHHKKILHPIGGNVFQSYDSIIVFMGAGHVYLDRNKWDCSKTTGKYRNQFLGETKKETQAKIDSGEYILVDLNRDN